MRRVLTSVFPILLALPLAGQQQDTSSSSSQQNPPAANPAPTKKSAQTPNPQQKKPSEAEQNPFPLAQSEAAAHPTQQPDDNATPAAPTPQTSAPGDKPSAAAQNPFPESQAAKAADQGQKASPGASGTGPPGAGSPGAGQDYSSSQSGFRGMDLPSDDAARPTNDAGAVAFNSGLAKKDTQVGLFYLQTHDFQGAYDRFVEATRVDPGNAEAVFGLAESAQRLNHRDEAVRNYQIYLSALPEGPRAKEARKALKELGATPKA
jgi:hypothetical protein